MVGREGVGCWWKKKGGTVVGKRRGSATGGKGRKSGILVEREKGLLLMEAGGLNIGWKENGVLLLVERKGWNIG